MDKAKEYYAFISYKREDEQWAKWLQHKLEHYKLPVNLNGRSDLPKEIRPVFRDTSELNPGNLPQQIRNALEQSRYLIVICSPRSAKSVWVNREVEAFIGMGKVDKIIPFIVEGSAFSKDPETECFPKALRELPSEQEILGANINEMGRDAAVVKTVSFMFGLRFDELWQRYEREKRRKRNTKIIGVSALVLVALVVAGLIWNQRTKIRSENWYKMEYEATLVSEKDNDLTDRGLSYVAQRALIEVLPENLKKPNRPYTSEAEKALRYAVMNNTEILGSVADAMYSSDGKKLLMVGGGLSIWDVEKGGEPRPFDGMENAIKAAFGPDGKRIAVGFLDGSIKIIGADDGKVISSMKAAQTIELTCADDLSIAYSPDGHHVASVVYFYDAGAYNSDQEINNGILQMWDVDSGEKLYEVELEGGYVIPYGDAIQFSPDGKRILAKNNGFRVLDAKTGKKLFDLTKNIESAFYLTNGKKILTVSGDGIITIWNAESGERIGASRKGSYISSVTICPQGEMAITIEDGKINILNINNGKKCSVLGSEYIDDFLPELYVPLVGYYDAKLSPDGRQLLSIATDEYEGGGGVLKIWTVDCADCTLDGSDENVRSISFSPDGHSVVTTDGKVVRVWDVAGQKEKSHFSFPYAQSAFFTSDGKRIIAQSNESFVCWDAENEKLMFMVDGISDYSGDVRVVYDSINEMVMAITEKGVGFYKDKTGEELGFVAGTFNTISYNLTNKGVVLINYDDPDQILVLDAETRKIIKTFDAQAEIYWGGAIFSPDGKELLYYANYEQSGSSPIYVVNSKTGKMIHEINHTNDIETQLESVSYSPNGKWIVSVSNEGEWIESASSPAGLVKVWDAENGAEIASFEGAEAVFSPDSRKLAIATRDKTIRIIDFPPLQEIIDKTRERFKDRPLTPEERRFYNLK